MQLLNYFFVHATFNMIKLTLIN